MTPHEEQVVMGLCKKRRESPVGSVRVAGQFWAQSVLQFVSRGHFNQGGATKEFAEFQQEYLLKPALETLRWEHSAGDIDEDAAAHTQSSLLRSALQATTFGLYAASGFPTYALEARDVSALEDRAVGDLPILTGKLPHMCFFVSWPADERLSVFWGESAEVSASGAQREYVDGAFVNSADPDGTLQLLFTSRLGDGTPLSAPGPTATIEKVSGRSLREALSSAMEDVSRLWKGLSLKSANKALKQALEDDADEGEGIARAACHRLAGAIAYVQSNATAIEGPTLDREMPIVGYGRAHEPSSHFERMVQALEDGYLPVTRIDANAVWSADMARLERRPQADAERAKLARFAVGKLARVAGRIEYATDEVDPEECVEPVERASLEEALLGDEAMMKALLTELKTRPNEVSLVLLGLKAMGSQVADRFRLRVEHLAGGGESVAGGWRRAVQDSLSGLNAHIADMPRPYEIVGIMTSHPEGPQLRCKLTIACQRPPSPMTPSFNWDEIECTHEDPTLLLLLASEGLDVGALGQAEPSQERQLHPLFRYHPERYASTRRYANQAAQQQDRWNKSQRDPSLTKERILEGQLEVMNAVAGMIVKEANDVNLRKPMRSRLKDDPDSMSAVMNAEMEMVNMVGNWRRWGRQIFDFPSRMMDLFAMTDVDGIPCANVKLPYNVQYLHFGPRMEIEIEPGWLVDGAYVEARAHGGWKVCVTSAPKDPEAAYGWTSKPEPMYVQVFGEREMAMSLAEAVDYALSDELAELKKKAAQGDGEITEELQAAFRDEGLELPTNLRVVKVYALSAASETSTLMRRLPQYKKALRLVVNAICYVTAYPEDVKDELPNGAPERLVKTAGLKLGSKDQKKAISKLEQLGFRPVHFCGREFVSRVRLGADGQLRGPGWTRGHWRNQAWGPKLTLRRLQWIMPYRTGVDEGDAEFGHLYLVT
jgi:hypothetical protein